MEKAIILDLNGVLIKSKPLSLRFEKEFHVPSAEFIQALKETLPQVRIPNALAIYSLFEAWLEKWNIELSEQEFLNFWFKGEYVDEKALEQVKELKEHFGCKVFTLSNNFNERITYYREHFKELFLAIDGAYFSCETGSVKPDVSAWLDIITGHQLQPENCYFVDDSQENIESARNLGIATFENTDELLKRMKKD